MTATLTWRAGVEAALARAARAEAIPGLVVAVAFGDGAPEHLVSGADGAGRLLAADSLVRVASVTKLLTALGVLRLVDAGRLALDDPLARYVPEAVAAQPGVTLRRLLTHTSGLSGAYPEALAPWTAGLTWNLIRQATLQTPLSRPPGSRVVYCGLNQNLLATVIDRVTGRPFPAALSELVLEPLGIEGYLGVEPPRAPAHIAGAPVDQFTRTALDRFNSAFSRSLPMPGGGLITTAAGMVELVRAFRVRPGGFLSPELAAEATRDQTGGLGGGVMGYFDVDPCPWGLGPALQGTLPWPPPTASARAYGHTGFTAALAWRDPEADVAWAIGSARLAPEERPGSVSAEYMKSLWCERVYPAIGEAILGATR